MKRILALIMACVMCLCLFAGCGGSSSQPAAEAEAPAVEAPAAEAPAEEAPAAEAPAAEAPAADGTAVLNIAIDGEPESLDIAMDSMDLASEVVYGTLFEQLVAFNGENEIIPELAESFEVSDDAAVYTYHLRQGVLFHNGEEMKAADVVASMNRWLDNASNAGGLVGDARFVADDDYTVSITMEQGTLYLNEMIAGLGQHAVIMPASVIASVGENELVKEYIGTGPYKFAEWPADRYIKLVRNDDYAPYGTEGDYSGWAGYKNAYYDEVYVYFPGDGATVANGIKTGEYDMTASLSGDYYAEFSGNPDFTIFTDESEMPMLIFNKGEGVAANALVRQAVQAVVNCDDALYASMGDDALYNTYSSYMFESSANWYTEAGSEYYNQNDPERAKELFTEAGWDFENDTFRILVDSGDSAFVTQAQVVQEELRSIGVDCDVLTYDSATYRDTRNNKPGEWDAFVTSFGPKVLPNMNLFLSTSWPADGTGCIDERVQADLAAIAAETDMDAAIALWNDLQAYMYEESVPVVKFGTTVLWGVSSSDITGAFAKERLTWVNARPAA